MPVEERDTTIDDFRRDIQNAYSAWLVDNELHTTAGVHPKFFEYNRTIWSWTGDTYYVSVHAISSVNWTDDSSCTGYCDPANMGLWVYSNSETAQQAYIEVSNDAVNAQLTPPTGPTIAPTVEYVHGRCLLLGTDKNSIYGQVVTQYCI